MEGYMESLVSCEYCAVKSYAMLAQDKNETIQYKLQNR